MPFQFLCPQGHLLEGDEAQAGQQAQCPYCGTVFVVPQPIPATPPNPYAAQPPAPAQAGLQTPPQQQPAAGPQTVQPPFPPTPPPQHSAVGPPPFQASSAESPPETGVIDFPGINTEPQAGRSGSVAATPQRIEVPSAAELPIVHLVCPNGHQLETPREMLGQEALCPFCRVQFRLRLEDSIEYRAEKAEDQQRRERRTGQLWLRFAIGAAVVVVLGIILLVILSL